jgi:hypothetical protein
MVERNLESYIVWSRDVNDLVVGHLGQLFPDFDVILQDRPPTRAAICENSYCKSVYKLSMCPVTRCKNAHLPESTIRIHVSHVQRISSAAAPSCFRKTCFLSR